MTVCHGCAIPCHTFLPPPFPGPGLVGVDVGVDAGVGVDVDVGVEVDVGVDVGVGGCRRWSLLVVKLFGGKAS